MKTGAEVEPPLLVAVTLNTRRPDLISAAPLIRPLDVLNLSPTGRVGEIVKSVTRPPFVVATLGVT
jgi:hypothetical protein